MNGIDIFPFPREGNSYASSQDEIETSAGSSPQLALESFTVSSDPTDHRSFGKDILQNG